jgi:hypothetical protein
LFLFEDAGSLLQEGAAPAGEQVGMDLVVAADLGAGLGPAEDL